MGALPENFPAAIVIVQHIAPQYPSYLCEILSQRTALRVKQAEHGELLRPGTVYTPVPDRHLLINPDGTFYLSDSEKMNFVRPCADKMFMSLAKTYKTRTIAIVLTGRDSDGALGVLAIKKYGGVVIAQDEATSECFSMPKSAIDTGKVDLVLPINAISAALVNLLNTKIELHTT